jgi:CheY-like chemotaxis protein
MEAIGQLAGGIAHDFNNILGGIIGYADLSLDHAAPDSVLESNLRQILKASDRAKRLASQILTFSRQGSVEEEVVYLSPIVREVMGLLKVSLPSSVIIVEQLAKTTFPVIADATKIHEVLMNLCTNAVHAMKGKGKLRVALSEKELSHHDEGRMGTIEPGCYAVIEVEDTGCGMDDKTLEMIFNPFFTTKPVGEGTGIGLAVVYGIVRMFSGNIQVESCPGAGTKFRIFLPKAEDNATKRDSDAALAITGAERVLFVDDEEVLVFLAQELLGSLGYTVTALESSTKALRILQENPDMFDILVSDQTMPCLTGIDLASEARRIRPDLPIVLCSGYSHYINPADLKAGGIIGFCPKPFTKEELGKAIRAAIDGKQPDMPGKGIHSDEI